VHVRGRPRQNGTLGINHLARIAVENLLLIWINGFESQENSSRIKLAQNLAYWMGNSYFGPDFGALSALLNGDGSPANHRVA
jgi:hypothetical protein